MRNRTKPCYLTSSVHKLAQDGQDKYKNCHVGLGGLCQFRDTDLKNKIDNNSEQKLIAAIIKQLVTDKSLKCLVTSRDFCKVSWYSSVMQVMPFDCVLHTYTPTVD